MSDRSRNSAPTTFADIPSAISSPASAAGPSPYASPDGPMNDLFGQAVAPASRSAPPVKEAVARTSGTYGRIGSVSSASAALQSSLVNRLRQQLDGAGSTLFSATWKRKVTPRGRPYWAHTASARRISGSDCGSWQSPTAQNARHGSFSAAEMERDPNVLHNQAYLASWPTPQTADINLSRGSEDYQDRKLRESPYPNLALSATLASWPTPMAGTPAQKGYNEAGNNDSSRKTVELCSWPTPNASDGSGGGQAKRVGGRHSQQLNDHAMLASWARATPTANEKVRSEEFMAGRQLNAREALGPTAMAAWLSPNSTDSKGQSSPNCKAFQRGSINRLADQVRGMTASGSPAQTEKRGQLNPRFSAWLMGYPLAWDLCAPLKKKR